MARAVPRTPSGANGSASHAASPHWSPETTPAASPPVTRSSFQTYGRIFETRYVLAMIIGQRPRASMTRAAVAAPEKFCWPVIRLPSRTAKLRHRPACT